MKAVLTDIQNGAFAKRFIDDQDAGAPEFKALRGRAPSTRSRRPAASCADYGVGQADRQRLRRGFSRALTAR